MTPDVVVKIAQDAVYIILLICTPVLGICLLVGLLVSVFQATTQIQEQTLAFVPKIVAVLLSILVFGPWMLSHLLNYTDGLFNNLHRYIG